MHTPVEVEYWGVMEQLWKVDAIKAGPPGDESASKLA
jgi:hypothetical protein